MIVTSDYLAALLTAYQAKFGQTWNQPAALSALKELAIRYPSTTLTETVPIIGAMTGGPQDVTHQALSFGGTKLYSLSITNRDWADGFEIHRNVFDDDGLALYANKPAELVEGHVLHIGELIGDLWESGTSALAYDGTAFLANSRTIEESGTIDNIIAGTGTTTAQLLADLRSAQQQMMAFKNNKGRKLGIRGNVIMTPDELYDLWYQALTYNAYTDKGSETTAPPGDSFTAGAYKVVRNHRLTDANNWGLLHVDIARGRSPFVWTDRKAPTLEGTKDTNSPEWRNDYKARYTTFGRYEAAFGEPRFAISVTNS